MIQMITFTELVELQEEQMEQEELFYFYILMSLVS
jgi:hypothetical protein